jgi:3-phenylpropionate/trans-cinnamate dioxygenase ferredoxin reductase subunit
VRLESVGIVGLSSGFDQTVVRGDPEAEKFSVFYYREGRLLAVHAVNSPRDIWRSAVP